MNELSATPPMSDQAKQIFAAFRKGKTPEEMLELGIARSTTHIEFVLEQMRVFALI